MFKVYYECLGWTVLFLTYSRTNEQASVRRGFNLRQSFVNGMKSIIVFSPSLKIKTNVFFCIEICITFYFKTYVLKIKIHICNKRIFAFL